MAKPEWGVKRTCFGCGARFYDLRRDPIICPVCATVYDPERQPRAKRGGAAAREDLEARRKPIAAAANADLEDDAGEDDELETEIADDLDDDIDDPIEAKSKGEADDLETENDDLIEDTSDLGEDDDDIGEVMEHIADDGDDKS